MSVENDRIDGVADCVIDIPEHAMGLIIGPRGDTISRICKRSGLTLCKLKQESSKRGPGQLHLRGHPTACAEAFHEAAVLIARAAENFHRQKHRHAPYQRPATIFHFDARSSSRCDGRRRRSCSPVRRQFAAAGTTKRTTAPDASRKRQYGRHDEVNPSEARSEQLHGDDDDDDHNDETNL